MKINKFSFLLIFSSLFMAIGYASINSITLDIKGFIEKNKNNLIYIKSIEYKNDNNANLNATKINNYYNTILNSTISLSNDCNSNITYTITINNDSLDYYNFIGVIYDDINYDNKNITYNLQGINIGDKIKPKDSLSFDITFHYNSCSFDNYTLNSFLNFKFDKMPLEFTVIGNAEHWTNNPVTLTVIPNEENIYYYSFDDGKNWDNNPSKIFYENNNDIKIKIKNNYGIESETYETKINFIDTTKPSINIPSNKLIVTLDENNVLNTIIPFEDDLSGIDENSIKITRNNEQIYNSNYFNYVGWYKINITASDYAGNTQNIDSSILVRWPTGGKYIIRKTELDLTGIAGTGKATKSNIKGLFKDTEDTGLNNDLPFSSKYYYSGSSVSNYINFANNTFRILNIPVNNDIKLIGGTSNSTIIWSNRKIYESNQFENWKNWWNNKYIYNSNDKNKITLTEQNINHIDNATFYAGRFQKDNNQSLKEIINLERTSGKELGSDNSPSFSGYFALPNVSDYLKACNLLDDIYNISTTQATGNKTKFKNNSWIDSKKDEFTMNAKRANAYDTDFWQLHVNIIGNKEIEAAAYYSSSNYRPVFYLKSDTIISGSGSTNDPFLVQEDWKWFDDVQTLQ